MGEARRRGTRDERVAQGKIRLQAEREEQEAIRQQRLAHFRASHQCSGTRRTTGMLASALGALGVVSPDLLDLSTEGK